MTEPGFNWTCRFCNRAQTVTGNYHSGYINLHSNDSKYGRIGIRASAVACANDTCKELTLDVSLHEVVNDRAGNSILKDDWILLRHLLPESSAKPFPDYIPASIRSDYTEACQIRDLSPKASATLARRCLQGMIRDFAGISKSRLVDEIRELRLQVESGHAPRDVQSDTIDAIDAVREIGNIGAHMERDINVIVDVDPDEAQVLLELIELLFEEWYVSRHERQARLSVIKQIAREKKEQKESDG